MFYCSLSFLLITLIGTFYFVKRTKELTQTYTSYQKHYRSCQYLKEAKQRLDLTQKEPEIFIQQELEPLSFLKHSKHRHNQTLNPTLPVHINPYENTLKHTSTTLALKPLKKTSFNLVKPVLVDEEDLKHLFSLVEHKTIFPYQKSNGTPYFFFTYFKIKKHSLGLSENVYEICYNLESLCL